MNRRSALLSLAAAVMSGAANAQSTTTFQVVGVRMNDVLNVREFPTADARVIDVIPPDARGVV
uniref:hypothetical protein n=1 Tax=Escherichia coli TaxID=562 RepID=UPI0019548744